VESVRAPAGQMARLLYGPARSSSAASSLQAAPGRAVAAHPLADPEFAGADIGESPSPSGPARTTARSSCFATAPACLLPGNGAGGDHPGDVPLEQAALAATAFELVRRRAMLRPWRTSSVANSARRRWLRMPGHRHAAEIPLARLLAGEASAPAGARAAGVLEKRTFKKKKRNPPGG